MTVAGIPEIVPGVQVYRYRFNVGDPGQRDDYVAMVRKLKRLGLTRSLEVGYELTEQGRAVLDAERQWQE